ncbi:MAG: CotH kinase family protein [Myxococcota bacterium]
MRALIALLACGSTTIVADDPATPGEDSASVVGLDGTCDPGAPPVYVDEGDEVRVRVACTGEGTAEAFEVLDLPEGARFERDTLTWTPGLADAGAWTFDVLSQGEDDDVGTIAVSVADAWDAAENEPVDPDTYTSEHGVPVVHLEVPGTTNFDDDVPSSLTFDGHTFAIELKYRGAASSYYPKKSYTVSFPSWDEFEADGFEKRRKIVLTTLFDDNSYVRQQLCYELWNALDPARHAVQTKTVVVYANGEYVGLYLLTDHVDGEYFEDWGWNEDWNLYKAVDHQANFHAEYNGSPKSSWNAGYEKQEGPEGDWADLDAFVEWAATTDDATFREELGDRFVMDELIDWWILVRFTESDDSGGKNAYLYFDPEEGLIHHVPWDFNHSFGQTWQTEREAASTDYDFFWSNNLFARALTDVQLGPLWETRMRDALAGPLAVDAIAARIDAHEEQVGPSITRDWEKWGESYRTYDGWRWRTDWTEPDEEIAYLRAWVEERHGWVTSWYP